MAVMPRVFWRLGVRLQFCRLIHMSVEEIERPKVLYHASPNKDLTALSARAESVRDPSEGPVVFGTPDIAYASCFLVSGSSDSWTKISRWSASPDSRGPWNFICSDRERFTKEDKGGTIYKLSPEGFETDPNKGTGLSEWTSKTGATPVGRIDYDSAFGAMLENGVQVRFTDKNTLTRMRGAEDHGYSLLKNIISENEKLGRNYIPIN